MAAHVKKKIGDNSMLASNMAVLFWVKLAIPETRKAFREKRLQKLTLWEHEGMLVLSGRAMERMKNYFWVSFLPVVMAQTRVAELIMLHAHSMDHHMTKGEIRYLSLPLRPLG